MILLELKRKRKDRRFLLNKDTNLSSRGDVIEKSIGFILLEKVAQAQDMDSLGRERSPCLGIGML